MNKLIFSVIYIIISYSTLFSQNIGDKTQRDSNFVFISAIKSIAGNEPTSEFTDINFLINILKNVYSLTAIDIAFTTVLRDSMEKHRETLSEASLSLNYGFLRTIDSLRVISFGGLIKIFDEVPYVGFQLGSIENNTKSPLFTSYIFVSFLWRAQKIIVHHPQKSYQNVYAEFALHSEKIEFLKYLRFKGGVLISLKGYKTDGIYSRIVLEVPIGRIFKF